MPIHSDAGSVTVEQPVRERIHALDVVRGFAVAGILCANVFVFFGLFAIPPERAAAFSTAHADRIVLFVEHVLVEGKFYSIFSLLFGIGFGLQLSRGGESAVPRFKRRLRILLAIGAAHAFLVWGGDILMLYAMLGFTMPWFARKTDRQLLRWTLGLLALPTILYALLIAIVLVVAGPQSLHATSAGSSMPAGMLSIFEAIGTGGYREAFVGNLIFVAGRWADLVMTMRFPKVLGMFVLGLWAVRAGIVADPASHRDFLVRWCAIGWVVGLPMNVVAAWAFEHWSYIPPSFGAMLGVGAQAIGFPLLAIGYAGTIALLVIRGVRIVNVFAPVGRMALTNYLMHSIICVVLASGYGFGMWWQTGASRAMIVAAIIIVLQIPLSAFWLSRFRFGPAEWVWRRLTYGRPI